MPGGNRIISKPAIHNIITVTCSKMVGIVVACYRVSRMSTSDMFNICIDIAFSIIGCSCARYKVNIYPASVQIIIDPVLSITTIKRICTSAAFERVVPQATCEGMISSIAFEIVVEITAQSLLNIENDIAIGITAGAGTQTESYCHSGACCRIINKVNAVSALNAVPPGTSD